MIAVLSWVMIFLTAFLTIVSFVGWKIYREYAYILHTSGWGVVFMAYALLVAGVIK